MKKFCAAMSVLSCIFLIASVLTAGSLSIPDRPVVPIFASAAEAAEIPETPAGDFAYRYDPNLEGIQLTRYTGTSIRVRIPEKIEGVPVVGLVGTFESSNIMEVHIPNSVTHIGIQTFMWCNGMTSLTIPNGVTHLEGPVFHGSSIMSVTLPDSVTHVTKDNSGTPFRGMRVGATVTYMGNVYTIADKVRGGYSDLSEAFYDLFEDAGRM